jgi:GntR family transcriptional regulator, rspAB operon transcriptional repressor
LVSIIPNRGYFVTNLTIKEMNDLYEYRAAVESACVELLCGARLQPEALAALGEVGCFRADHDGKFAEFIRADTDFHVGLARLTHNTLMLRSIAQLRSQTERIFFAAEEAIEVCYYGEVPAKQHTAILQAIRRNNPELARRLMREHILSSKNQMLELAGRDSRFLIGV